VPRVEDDRDSVEDLEKLVGQAVEKLRAVCVRDDADEGGYFIPAATSPAACAADASCPVSSARMAAVAKAWARCWSRLRSMFASENQAQYFWRASLTFSGGRLIAAVAHCTAVATPSPPDGATNAPCAASWSARAG